MLASACKEVTNQHSAIAADLKLRFGPEWVVKKQGPNEIPGFERVLQMVQAKLYSTNRNKIQSSDTDGYGSVDCWPIRHQSKAGQWLCWLANQQPATSNHDRKADQPVTNRSVVPTRKFAHPNKRCRARNRSQPERLFGHCTKDLARNL